MGDLKGNLITDNKLYGRSIVGLLHAEMKYNVV